MSDTNRNELFSTWLDGRLSAADSSRLDRELRGSREARDEFRTWAMLHTLLTDQAAATAFPEAPIPSAGLSRSRWLAAMVALSLATALAGIVAVVSLRPAGDGPMGEVTNVRFPAVEEGQKRFSIGQPVAAGPLTLLGGALEVTLRNGVVIVLEGEADLDLRGELEAFLHAGSAVIRMPAGMRGFRLATPTTDVLDLGTEFAVRTGPGLVTDVQVYDGAVMTTGRSAAPEGAFPRRLEAGEARRFRPAARADGEPIPYSESRFVRHLPSEPGREYPRFRDADETARRFGWPRIDAIRVMRVVDRPVIDGVLDDWPASGGFHATLRETAEGAEWVDGRMAYDDRCLYIAARVGDPAPLRSVIDPDVDPGRGWQGGSVQVRLSTDREMGWPVDANAPAYYQIRGQEPSADDRRKAANPKLSHLTMWHHAPTGRACLVLNHGMDVNECVVNPPGFAGCFRRGEDGRNYTLEYAIPWELLNAADAPPRGGDVLAAHWQVHWSDDSGLIWREQLIEIRNLHEIRRIVSFERAAIWGRAEYE
jgi:ferric-dicitrate binding protein FerR (iron transport regulator)